MKRPGRFFQATWVALALLACCNVSFAQPGPFETLQRQRCYVTDFGAIPDDGKDDSVAINKCIREVQRYTKTNPTGRGEVVFVPGEYEVIEETILVGSDSAVTRSIFLVGGPSYSETANASTVILDGHTMVDRPVVNLQGLRWGGMDGFLVLGPNAKPAANSYPSQYVDSEADWVTVGVRTDQYSPQCGVAVDAWNGTTPPGGGYPGVTYSGSRPTPVSCESFGITIRNVTCRGHYVGFAIGCSNTDVRADLLSFEMINPQFCTFGMSVGMRNSLGCKVEGFNFDRCHTGFTNNTHGKKAGDLFAFRDGFFNGLQRWFRINGNTSPKVWSNIFAEYCFRLGDIGVEMGSSPASPTSFTVSSWRHYKPMVFQGCRVRTWTASPATEVNDPPIKLITYAPVVFDGCELEGFNTITNIAGPGPVTVKNSTFGFAPGVLGDGNMQQVVGYQPDNGEHVRIDDSLSATWLDPEPSEPTLGFSRDSTAETLPNRIWLQPWSKWVHEKSSGKSYVVKGAGATSVAFPASSYNHTTDSGGNVLTFTAGTAANFFVGDLIYWRHTTISGAVEDTQPYFVGLRIISKSGSTITCRKLFDPQFYDTGYAPSSILVVPTLWAPNPALGLNADLTSGGANLDNPPANYAEALQVGAFVRGDDIPADTRIATVPGYLSDHGKRAYLGNPDLAGSVGPIITDQLCSDGYDGFGGGLVPTLTGTWRLREETWTPTGTTPGGNGWQLLWNVGFYQVTAEAEIKALSGASSGIFVRYKDANNWTQVTVSASSVQIYEMISGVGAFVGSGGVATVQAGDTVRVTVNGTSGTAGIYRDGVQQGTLWTTNSLTLDTGGVSVGFRSTGTGSTWGWIKCEPAATAPSPTMTKNATATTSNVELSFAELQEVTQ